MDEDREQLKRELLQALGGEMKKISGGMMDAMAALGLLVYAGGNLGKDEFLELARKAATQLRDSGNTYAGQLLDGMAKRIETFEIAQPETRRPRH